MSTLKYDVFITYKDPSKDFADLLYNGFKQKGFRVRVLSTREWFDYKRYKLLFEACEEWILIELTHPKEASLPDFLGTGVVYGYNKRRKKFEIGCFVDTLDIYKAARGIELHVPDWKKAFYLESYSDGCNIIDKTKGYQSFIDEIFKRLSEMRYGKVLDVIFEYKRRMLIFLDMESSPFLNPEDLKAFVKRETDFKWEDVVFYAYGHSSAEQKKKFGNSGHSHKQNVKLYERGGVRFIHIPGGRKDTLYIGLLVDMFRYSHHFPPPSTIMLITGNISYANTLHALGHLGHKIILVTSSEVGDSVTLINASVYTWSDVAKGTSSSQVQIKELSDDNNNWPGSILVKREDLVATLSSQFKELSVWWKLFQSIDPFGIVFWDLENCPILRGVPTIDVVVNICMLAADKIGVCFPRICAYADFSRIHGEVRETLRNSGVILIDTPHVKKNAADEAMIIDMLMYSKLVRSPSSIVVIAADGDFATTLHAVAGSGHDIFLVVRSGVGVSESLTSASKDYCYWSEVAYGIDLTGLKGQLVELLERNGQLRLGSLVAEYQKIFKKPLRLSEYKARKLVNLLKRMSYMISVEVLNGETLVKLKGDKPSSSRKMIRKEREIDYNIKDLFE